MDINDMDYNELLLTRDTAEQLRLSGAVKTSQLNYVHRAYDQMIAQTKIEMLVLS